MKGYDIMKIAVGYAGYSQILLLYVRKCLIRYCLGKQHQENGMEKIDVECCG